MNMPVKSGDIQQYDAEPHSNYRGSDRGVMPSVSITWMTPDPLGAIAACTQMYEGKVVRSLDDLSDDDRREAWENANSTHLTMPLEAVKIHFLLEGVDRAFTHQLVRQRTAAFAQESLRFAVPGKLEEATSLPPSLMPMFYAEGVPVYSAEQEKWREIWFNAIQTTDAAYHYLVETGMPAEEARGLLPHATATRANFITDLRNLSGHAGNRLCTQAQFHWRLVFNEIVRAIKDYPRNHSDAKPSHQWQFDLIANSGLFRPVCYQLGKCPFKAKFDRACTIKSRVDDFHRAGVPASEWDHDHERAGDSTLHAIHTQEWLMDPDAARLRGTEAQ